MATQTSPLRIGTRGSPLALAQAHETRDRLMAVHELPDEAFEIVVIQTTGDRIQDRALSEIGGKGLFTKEIEEALIDGRIDIAVHSMKDAPTFRQPGLMLTTYLPREDARDAFLCPTADSVEALPHGAVVGSSSLRRRAQVLNRRPDLKVVEFRGNVQTRLRKLAEGVAEATFLACAGLNRLGADDPMIHPMPVEAMLPAVAQGAIGIEARSADEATQELLAPIDDAPTRSQLNVERAFLEGLDGSCRTPIAGFAVLSDDWICFTGEILRPDGSERHVAEREGPISDAAAMGADAAKELRSIAGPGFFNE
ncbi:MAG: hydroxymethylbilane synthase [Pseudomonadota bacterium]